MEETKNIPETEVTEEVTAETEVIEEVPAEEVPAEETV